jgi:hypothetical protein
VTTLSLMLVGHAAVFTATAPDVARLLNSSLERLLLQLWPAEVFACFMVFAGIEDAAQLEAGPAAPKPTIYMR